MKNWILIMAILAASSNGVLESGSCDLFGVVRPGFNGTLKLKFNEEWDKKPKCFVASNKSATPLWIYRTSEKFLIIDGIDPNGDAVSYACFGEQPTAKEIK